MWLLYVDESGNHKSNSDHFVVGGIAVPEECAAQAQRDLTALLARHVDGHLLNRELHASAIRQGRGCWRGIPRSVREELLQDALCVLAGWAGEPEDRHGSRRPVLFAVARAPGAVPYVDPIERCFEELFLRFTQMVLRCGSDVGLVVADKARYESTLQPVVARWRDVGTRVARLTKLVEVPLFVDSKAARLVQAADLVAHAVYLAYERGDESLLKPVLRAFDTVGGRMHGLVHLHPEWHSCSCVACASRRPLS